MDSATSEALEAATESLGRALDRLRALRLAPGGPHEVQAALEEAEATVEAAKRRLDEARQRVRGG